MKKVILLDGNNLLFRSYYATAYTGNIMRNSNGLPTNALYGFVGMINKIINEEQPEYMMVAFDIGTNFRKKEDSSYKDGRVETPKELKEQMPIAREILKAMNIKYFELEPYEADDIVGTFAHKITNSSEYEGLIISSDKDLLQLITPKVHMKLLKQHDYIYYDEQSFINDWGFTPIHMIDYKALAGDSSDNIPGVKGCGEKTAIKLLKEYKDIETIYNNIDQIKGSLKDKLINSKDDAFHSKKLATILLDVPIDTDINNLKFNGFNNEELALLFKKLEFTSFLNKLAINKEQPKINYDYIEINDITNIKDSDIYALYLETDCLNYHNANIVGIGLCTDKDNYYIEPNLLKELINKIKDKIIYTFDLKKVLSLLSKDNLTLNNVPFDLMMTSYLLEESDSEDISHLMIKKDINVRDIKEVIKKGIDKEEIIKKVRFIYDNKEDEIKRLKLEDMYDLYQKIELPLINVLFDMEKVGVKCDTNLLKDMGESVKVKIDIITNRIYQEAGTEFNISSPKQLSDVLYDRLGLPHGRKSTKSGYSTDIKALDHLKGMHPIIDDIIEYRYLTKLYSTYLEGLIPYVREDGKIHTIYKQNLTRTGRLSSVEPNLQNIPTKDEDAAKIKKAFTPANDLFMSCDYSQIELRLLAHISGSKELQDAFIKGEDIHQRVAADINGINIDQVTKLQRKQAKAVIFGIVYGISGFGLGENLQISAKEAKEFIDKYYELYPGVRRYMDEIVKEANEHGVVRTLMNRKRTIMELMSTNFMVRKQGERIALNTPIQGTCADIMKKAMVDIYDEFKKQNIKSKIVMQIHDEIIIDCYKDEVEKIKSIVISKMENAIKLDVPIKVSCDIGDNWYSTK